MKNILNSKNKNILNKKLYDFLNTGKVVYLRCLTLKIDEVRFSNFVGMCISMRKKSNTITIKNTIKKEKVQLTFCANSPLIKDVLILKKYRKRYRLRKIYYK